MGLSTALYIKKNTFINNDNQAKVVEYDEEGKRVMGAQRDFRKTSAPNAIQWRRPPFDTTRRKWMVDITQEELDKLVQSSGLTYEKGVNKGQLIKTANLRNPSDAFFNHSELQTVFESGSSVLDDDNPIDAIIKKWMNSDYRFANRGNRKEGDPMSGLVTYEITDAETESKALEDKYEKPMEAQSLLHSMGFEKKKLVAQAMAIPMIKPEPGPLTQALYIRITEQADVRNKEYMASNIDTFMKLAKMPTEELNLRAIVGSSIGKALTKRLNGAIYLRGQFIGNNLDQACENLMSDDPEFADAKSEVVSEYMSRKND